MKRSVRRLIIWSILTVLTAILYHFAFDYPEIVEDVYSRGMYPVLTQIFGFLSGLLPISLIEILLYIAVIALISQILRLILCIFWPLSWPKAFARITAIIVSAMFLFITFIWGWAFNYARKPLAESLSYDTSEATVTELANVCVLLASKANVLRGQVEEDENGVFELSDTVKDTLNATGDVYDECAPELLNSCRNGNVKGVATPHLLSITNTTGIFAPYTYECNVNTSMPDLYIPATAAHEHAHLQGWAREDEANFISWYVCRNSENTDFAYSATMLALTHCMNSLYKVSPETYMLIRGTLCEGILRDYAAEHEYWDKFDTELADNATEVYNSYLEVNGVPDGTQSYGRMVDLIIGVYRAGEL